jgi:hypothetical protein
MSLPAVFFNSSVFMYFNGPMTVGILSISEAYTNYFDPTDDCSNIEPNLSDYGLIVRDAVYFHRLRHRRPISIRGEVFLPEGFDTDNVIQKISTCPVNNNRRTGLFDFDSVMEQATNVSRTFSTYQLSIYLDESGNLATIGNKTNGYDAITMNTCNNGNCPLYSGKISDPSAFLLNETVWDGPVSGQWPLKLIINVCVYHPLDYML